MTPAPSLVLDPRSVVGHWLGPICALLVWCVTTNAQDETRPEHQDARPTSFDELDKDRNGRLTRREFTAQAGLKSVLSRDFVLFDADRDDELSKLEFAGCGHDAALAQIPDPVQTLVTAAMEAIDESHEGWSRRPEEVVDSRIFTVNFMRSISKGHPTAISDRILRQSDPDEDHHVSRDEALLFLQQQLGVVWLSKLDPWEAPPVDEDALFVKRGLYRIVPLRQRDGKLVDFARFLRIDRNRDNEIDKSEYVGRQPSFGSTGRSFDAQDRDGDGRLSVAEFGRPGGPNLFDLLGWFRSADTDLDALLSPEEMDAASIGLRKNLVGSSFSGFDTDDDGRLSLREYRLTMHASLNYPWTVLPRDSDRDQQISFAEFRFGDRDAFHLQRWFFFHRLDANGDGKLSPREFRFRSPGRTTVQLFSNDGRRSRIVFEAAAGELGGASLAADGKALLLHQSSRDDHGQLNQARIVLLDLETGKLTPLLDGALPSWSPSEARFVCERGDQRRSIWMVDRDGGQRELVDGFAPEWSPDGQSIAFFQQAYRSLMLLDPATGNVTTVIGPEDHEYQFFWRNMAWSPDGKRLALRGDARNRSDLLVVDLEQKPSFRVRLSGNVPLGPEFVWSPNGRRLLFQMRNPLERRDQWHELDPAGAGPAKVVEAFDNGLSPKTGCFTPNGEWYISVSKH